MTPRHFIASVLLLCLTSCGNGGNSPSAGPSAGSPQPSTDPCPLGSKFTGTLPRSLVADTDTASPTSNATGTGRIFFDGGMTPQERGAFVTAMDYLDRTSSLPQDPTLLSYMHLGSFDRSSVRGWLESRIQYIVPSNVDESKLVKLEDDYRSYENPTVLPPALQPCLTASATPAVSAVLQTSDGSGGEVVMSNIGALIYLMGKAKHVLFGVQADGLGTIKMTSPRSGVLQIGTGLFLIPEKYPNVVRIFQLTTLIHESRHSDGHGVTAGFLHAICPSGDFKGTAACDNNLNGPYEIETMAMKTFMQSCASCTAKEQQILQLLYLDTASRRIDAGATVWDDAPEGQR